MAWVYILRGDSGRHYIGSTVHLDRRIEEHRKGQTHTTARLGGNLRVIGKLELPTLAEARALERELKRKKNPVLGLKLLEQRGGEVVW